MTTVDRLPSLGALHFLRRLPQLRDVDAPGSGLLYLLRTGRIVRPDQRIRGGWICEVWRPTGDRWTLAADLDIATAAAADATFARGGPGLGLAAYSTAWLGRVWDRHPGGHLPMLAAELIRHVDPQTWTVELNGEVAMKLVRRVSLRAPGLRALVRQLVDDDLLYPIEFGAGSRYWGTYAITAFD